MFENEHIRTGLAIFGGMLGAITTGAQILRTIVARETGKIELAVLDNAGEIFAHREVVEVHIKSIERRLERIESRLDQLRNGNDRRNC